MSEKKLLILRILRKHHPHEMYGLDIVGESEGELSRATIYIHLDQLEESGDIISRQENRPLDRPGEPRKLYRLGANGHRTLQSTGASDQAQGELIPAN